MASHAIEFEGMQLYAPILYGASFLAHFQFFPYPERRGQSRDVVVGPSLRPSIITMEFFYIHAFVFQPSYDPIGRDEAITYLLLRGRAGGGSRYAFYIELRNGKTISFFFGKSKRNEVLVAKLDEMLAGMGLKYMIQVRIQSSVELNLDLIP